MMLADTSHKQMMTRVGEVLRSALVMLIAAVAFSGCLHRAQAKTTAAPPPLDVPLPPPRIIQAADGEVPQPVGLIDERAPAPVRPRTATARPEPSKAEPPKTEPAADLTKPP